MNNFKLRLLQIVFVALVPLVLFTGCGTVSHPDGPPHFYVDASKVPDAVPRQEKISKYGNYPRYVVLGQAYHTLPTSKGYEERGIASWYGTKFNKRKTSSGERYNMLGMTAAHKTLPLPTYVQVTNLKNNRQIIVKVNDRGPFAPNRIIDLSYVAAIKLGMIGHGTAYVDVKAIDPIEFAKNGYHFFPVQQKEHRYAFSPRKISISRPIHLAHHSVKKDFSSKSNGIYLQLGAFQNLDNAQRLKHRVWNLMHTPVVISKLSHHKNKTLYHVRIGPLKDLVSANRLSEKLKTYGLSGKPA